MREDIFLIEAVLGLLKENDLIARKKVERGIRQLNAAGGEPVRCRRMELSTGNPRQTTNSQQDAVWRG
jgi:hypothetical protein